jgi:N-acetyl-anhydromuramoyl-L-alanine amidase
MTADESAFVPRIHRETGLLIGARQVLSPYHDARPAHADIDLIVVHGISLPPGEFGGPGIDQLFCGNLSAKEHPYFATIAGLRVSAHVCINRAGEISQYVPFHRRAWHAGVSTWRGREACNDFSIGIELEGADERPYADVQYSTLAALIISLQMTYPNIADDHLVGHCDIAPGRKTDPGVSFDWASLQRQMQVKRGF